MSDKPARAIKLNVINEPKDSYTGGPSSLCPGCGHDQISNVIVNAARPKRLHTTSVNPTDSTPFTDGCRLLQLERMPSTKICSILVFPAMVTLHRLVSAN